VPSRAASLIATTLVLSLANAGAPSVFAVMAAATALPSPQIETIVAQSTRADNSSAASARAACHSHLRHQKWHPYLGTLQATLDDAVDCFVSEDAANGVSPCLQHVHALVSEHFEDGGEYLTQLSRSLNEVVPLSDELDGHAGVCEVAGAGFIPFVRLRHAHTHVAGSRLSRHRRLQRLQDEVVRRARARDPLIRSEEL
jgi:hypothetical protein